METKTLSLKTRIFLNHETGKANDIKSRMKFEEISIGTRLRLALALSEVNKKINLLENGKISEYLGYN